MNLQLKYEVRPDGTKSVTIPDESRAMVISFVQENARKPTDAIEAVVQEGHDQLMQALAGVSEAQAQHKPSANDWSILELMDHVVTTKQIVGVLCRSLGDGHRPPGAGAEWEEQSAQDGVTVARFATIAEARAAADTAHSDLLTLIRGLDTVDVETRFRHFLFGALNSREWAVFQRIHDADHTPQIASIKGVAGFPSA
ncbi:MAG TPA: DinB family protein [Dehalococcoidia bacterium]|jgi:hypothetical protein